MKAIVLNFFATMREELCGILAAKEQQLLEGIDSEYVEVLKTMQSIKSEVKMIYGNK